MYEKYFKILELNVGADEEAVKKAYRRLAKKYHPDVCKLPDAHDKFIAVCEAYEMLLQRGKSIAELNREAREAYFREVKLKARKRAEAKKEKLRKELDDYKKSGLYDVVLLVKYLFSFLVPIIGLFFISVTFTVVINHGNQLLMKYVPVGALGFLLILIVLIRYKNWFKHGAFYFNKKLLINKIKLKNEISAADCYYCKGKNANSKSYRISMVRVNSIRLSRQGALSGNVEYKKIYRIVEIPRSLRAYKTHIIVSFMKVFLIAGCIIFLPVDSFLWRFILGVMLAGGLATSVYFFLKVRSRANYLMSKGMVFKMLLWLNIILLTTKISPDLDFINSYTTYLALFLLIFFDAVLESILDAIPGKFAQKPAFVEPPKVSELKEKGFRSFLNAPLITTVYPFVKWLFG